MGLDIYKEARVSKVDKTLLKEIYFEVLRHFKLKDLFEVEISIVKEQTIQNVNRQTRGIDKVTDVLSFPSCDFKFPFVANDYVNVINLETGKIVLGEIMLCEKRAKQQAIEYNHSFDREVGFLVLHGLLHLLGFDHIEKDDETIMMGHANKILEDLKLSRDV